MRIQSYLEIYPVPVVDGIRKSPPGHETYEPKLRLIVPSPFPEATPTSIGDKHQQRLFADCPRLTTQNWARPAVHGTFKRNRHQNNIEKGTGIIAGMR
jgi:hypothetical protein